MRLLNFRPPLYSRPRDPVDYTHSSAVHIELGLLAYFAL